jgi:hypothetical protein
LETTVAAPQMPFLRKCVNAVLGAGLPVRYAAKAGNATFEPTEAWGDWPNLSDEIRPARNSGGGGVRVKADGPVQSEIAPHGSGF